MSKILLSTKSLRTPDFFSDDVIDVRNKYHSIKEFANLYLNEKDFNIRIILKIFSIIDDKLYDQINSYAIFTDELEKEKLDVEKLRRKFKLKKLDKFSNF